MFSALRISSKICKVNLKNNNVFTTFKHLKTSTPKNTTLAVSINVSKNKTVGIWLAGCSGMVAGAVVLGGVTRYLLPPFNLIPSYYFFC